MVKTQDLLGTH